MYSCYKCMLTRVWFFFGGVRGGGWGGGEWMLWGIINVHEHVHATENANQSVYEPFVVWKDVTLPQCTCTSHEFKYTCTHTTWEQYHIIGVSMEFAATSDDIMTTFLKALATTHSSQPRGQSLSERWLQTSDFCKLQNWNVCVRVGRSWQPVESTATYCKVWKWCQLLPASY